MSFAQPVPQEPERSAPSGLSPTAVKSFPTPVETTGLRRHWKALCHHVLHYALRRRHIVAHAPWLQASFRTVPRDVHGRHLYKSSIHEPGVTQVLLRYLTHAPQDVIFDVGANLGYYSVVFDRALGGLAAGASVAVHAFEPEPRNFALLQDNLARNHTKRVEAFQVAASDEQAKADLYLYKASNCGKHSLVPFEGMEAVSVEQTTLDTFWQQQGLGDRRLSLLKIDVEGAEHRVLAGAQQTLQRCSFILAEFSPKFLRRGQLEPAAHLAQFTELGFVPFGVTGEGQLESLETADLARREKSLNIAWLRQADQDRPWWRPVTAG